MDKTIKPKPNSIGEIWAAVISALNILPREDLFSFLKDLLPKSKQPGFKNYDESQINSMILILLNYKSEEELINLLQKKCDEFHSISDEDLEYIVKEISSSYLISEKNLLLPINSKATSSNNRVCARGSMCIILRDIYNLHVDKITKILSCTSRSYYRYIAAINNLSSNLGFEKDLKEIHVTLEKKIFNYKTGTNV